MRMMRGIIVLGLLLSLPGLAVYGDVDRLLVLLRSDAGQAVAADVTTNDDATASVGDLSPPEQNLLPPHNADMPRSVYPTFKPKVSRREDDPSAPGKRLRPAIYRPLADGEAPPIRRVAAQPQDQTSVSEGSTADDLDEIGRQLQSLGAQRYRMEEAAGDAHFVCEFPPPGAAGRPMVFQARSADRAAAMRDVLRQARAWDDGVNR